MKYYYSRKGEPVGPLSKDEIAAANITPATLVWTEGMEVWVPAREMPMLADILDGSYLRGAGSSPRTAQQQPGKPRPRPAGPGKYDFDKRDSAEAPQPRPQAQQPRPQAQPDMRNDHMPPRTAPVQYYAIISDIKVGPMFIEDMKAAGVKYDTLVWKDGLAQWQAAGSIGELQSLFVDKSAFTPHGAAAGPSVPPPPNYNRAPRAQQAAGECLSYTTASVFAIILGALGVVISLCGAYWNLVLAGVALGCGIAACVKSSDSNRLKQEGRMQEAIAASKGAKSLCTVSFVLAGIGIILPILYLLGLITLFAAIGSEAF